MQTAKNSAKTEIYLGGPATLLGEEDSKLNMKEVKRRLWLQIRNKIFPKVAHNIPICTKRQRTIHRQANWNNGSKNPAAHACKNCSSGYLYSLRIQFVYPIAWGCTDRVLDHSWRAQISSGKAQKKPNILQVSVNYGHVPGFLTRKLGEINLEDPRLRCLSRLSSHHTANGSYFSGNSSKKGLNTRTHTLSHTEGCLNTMWCTWG